MVFSSRAKADPATIDSLRKNSIIGSEKRSSLRLRSFRYFLPWLASYFIRLNPMRFASVMK